MEEKNYKTIDNIIMERIFDIDDGSYTLKSSIGNLIVNIKNLETKEEYDYFNKKVLVNIYNNLTNLFSKYYYEIRTYQGDDMLGGYGNRYVKYAIDYPEYELFKNINMDIYGYEKINDDEVIVYLDKDKNRICHIKEDLIRIDNKNRTEKCYKVTNNLIYDNRFEYIKININTGEISIKINGSFIKFDKDENIISKLNMYSEKMKELEEYIEKNMNDIKSLINFDTNLKIGNMYLVNENGYGILQTIRELKNIKELYNEGIELLDYEHDEKIKREIATGLNEFCKKRIGLEEEIVYARTTPEGKMISKLIKLNNGYYTTLTSKGLIEIDVNLYKDITIAFNNNLVFKIEYGEIQYISKILMDIMIDINNKIDIELAKQDKINNHNEEIEKQNEIKRLEKRLKELKNN